MTLIYSSLNLLIILFGRVRHTVLILCVYISCMISELLSKNEVYSIHFN